MSSWSSAGAPSAAAPSQPLRRESHAAPTRARPSLTGRQPLGYTGHAPSTEPLSPRRRRRRRFCLGARQDSSASCRAPCGAKRSFRRAIRVRREFPERATAFGDYRYNDKLSDHSLVARSLSLACPSKHLSVLQGSEARGIEIKRIRSSWSLRECENTPGGNCRQRDKVDHSSPCPFRNAKVVGGVVEPIPASTGMSMFLSES